MVKNLSMILGPFSQIKKEENAEERIYGEFL
jgi:hypothetical protein